MYPSFNEVNNLIKTNVIPGDMEAVRQLLALFEGEAQLATSISSGFAQLYAVIELLKTDPESGTVTDETPVERLSVPKQTLASALRVGNQMKANIDRLKTLLNASEIRAQISGLAKFMFNLDYKLACGSDLSNFGWNRVISGTLFAVDDDRLALSYKDTVGITPSGGFFTTGLANYISHNCAQFWNPNGSPLQYLKSSWTPIAIDGHLGHLFVIDYDGRSGETGDYVLAIVMRYDSKLYIFRHMCSHSTATQSVHVPRKFYSSPDWHSLSDATSAKQVAFSIVQNFPSAGSNYTMNTTGFSYRDGTTVAPSDQYLGPAPNTVAITPSASSVTVPFGDVCDGLLRAPNHQEILDAIDDMI